MCGGHIVCYRWTHPLAHSLAAIIYFGIHPLPSPRTFCLSVPCVTHFVEINTYERTYLCFRKKKALRVHLQVARIKLAYVRYTALDGCTNRRVWVFPFHLLWTPVASLHLSGNPRAPSEVTQDEGQHTACCCRFFLPPLPSAVRVVLLFL